MLIGLVGYKGSGKGEVARALEAHRDFSTVKMAGALKEMLRSLLAYQGVEAKMIERMIEGDLKEVPLDVLGGRTPRHAMQTLGTEWGRDFIGDGYWVKTFNRRAEQFRDVVCDDVRFHNEADAIKRRGGFLVRVVRPDNRIDLTHQSEREIASIRCDVAIVNDKDVAHLHRAAQVIVEELRDLAAA